MRVGGLNKSRPLWMKASAALLGFLWWGGDLRDNGFIHPTHPPPSILFSAEFISVFHPFLAVLFRAGQTEEQQTLPPDQALKAISPTVSAQTCCVTLLLNFYPHISPPSVSLSLTVFFFFLPSGRPGST